MPGAGARAPLPPQRSSAGWWLVALLILAAAAGAWWLHREAPPPPPPVTAQPVLQPARPPASAAAVPAAPVAAVPLPVPPPPAAAPAALDEGGVTAALAALVGQPAMRTLVIGDDFVRRFVVTVDNLAREQAPARLWPVRPTPGRYAVIERDGQLYADPDNAARYTSFVLLVEHLDKQAVVALYARLLPLLQRAYEELGYPGQRFHDRLIAVIDHLLAAPPAPELLPLTLVEVKGEIESTAPWLRYEFADPALEAASAGHKIMLRVGAVNERRLKTQLRALRAELVRQAQR